MWSKCLAMELSGLEYLDRKTSNFIQLSSSKSPTRTLVEV